MPSRFTIVSVAAALCACTGSDGRTVITVYSPHGADMLTHYELAELSRD